MDRNITIRLSDEVDSFIKARAKRKGFATEAECVEAILKDALDWAKVPRVPDDALELEAELLKGLEGEDIILTEDDWAEKKAELIERHRRKTAG